MKKNKIMGIGLIVVGLIAALVIAAADLIGLGGYYGFGPLQIFGVAGSLVMVVAGAVMFWGE